ncbi:unnamed protein product [Urochloa humidicola]
MATRREPAPAAEDKDGIADDEDAAAATSAGVLTCSRPHLVPPLRRHLQRTPRRVVVTVAAVVAAVAIAGICALFCLVAESIHCFNIPLYPCDLIFVLVSPIISARICRFASVVPSFCSVYCP